MNPIPPKVLIHGHEVTVKNHALTSEECERLGTALNQLGVFDMNPTPARMGAEGYAAGYRAGIERAAKLVAKHFGSDDYLICERIRALLDEPQEPPK